MNNNDLRSKNKVMDDLSIQLKDKIIQGMKEIDDQEQEFDDDNTNVEQKGEESKG